MRLNAARLATATFIITWIRAAGKVIPAHIVSTRSVPSVSELVQTGISSGIVAMRLPLHQRR
jgi:hypothetical protein